MPSFVTDDTIGLQPQPAEREEDLKWLQLMGPDTPFQHGNALPVQDINHGDFLGEGKYFRAPVETSNLALRTLLGEFSKPSELNQQSNLAAAALQRYGARNAMTAPVGLGADRGRLAAVSRGELGGLSSRAALASGLYQNQRLQDLFAQLLKAYGIDTSALSTAMSLQGERQRLREGAKEATRKQAASALEKIPVIGSILSGFGLH